jgi:glycosyltransferase involved in cell wall biosynthesis
MRIVFWQYMHVMHQSATLRALAKLDHQVYSIAEQVITPQQVSMGYFVPDFDRVKAITNPDLETIRTLTRENVSESVHIIGGIRGYKLGYQALNACKKAGARVGWLVEGGDPRGLGGIVRRLVYSAQVLQFGKCVDFVLAMGRNGVRWYQACGWPNQRVFPYAYITETPEVVPGFIGPQSIGKAEILFLGQLVHRKGLDLLLLALARLQDKKWQLTVIGAGTEQEKYKQMTRSLGIHARVDFIGVLSNKDALEKVKASDLVVVPSRFDGWGAVTNEGLMCGTPVVCSSNCGSSDLIQENWRGSIFKNTSVNELTRALTFWIDHGKKNLLEMKRIAQWSQRITGESAAAYVDAVIRCVYQGEDRPIPPWYKSDSV